MANAKHNDVELQLVARMLLSARRRGDPDYDHYLREVSATHNRELISIEAEIEQQAAAYGGAAG